MNMMQGTLRKLSPPHSNIDFSSNDYLGLSMCPNIRARLSAEIALGCPLGSTGSRLLSGNTIYHERVETFLARTFKFESALLFSSGFLANLGVLSTLGNLGAEFFSDELNHASLVDGMKGAILKPKVFRHNDFHHLEELLSKSKENLKVIVTESVFSMDGDISPLSDLIQLAEKSDAWIVIDEAHATGLFGPRGLGRLEELGVDHDRMICIHTGGKALGGQGAFVLSNLAFRELLINRARSFIFSTALSPLSSLQIQFSVEEVLNQPERGAELLKTAESFRNELPKGFDGGHSQSPIIPMILGSNESALSAAANLQASGLNVKAIRFPSVPKGQERLRITLNTTHTATELKTLGAALHRLVSL
jgi:8-amino-7-oxononanoate synthase